MVITDMLREGYVSFRSPEAIRRYYNIMTATPEEAAEFIAEEIRNLDVAHFVLALIRSRPVAAASACTKRSPAGSGCPSSRRIRSCAQPPAARGRPPRPRRAARRMTGRVNGPLDKKMDQRSS
jgi:hypothetical protein